MNVGHTEQLILLISLRFVT